MRTACEICVLGPLRVRFADGREPVVKFRTRKAALLLTYLALHQGKTHSREFLIELLWPELELTAGRDNLSTTLSSLRRLLEPAGSMRLIESDPLTVRLCTDGVQVDAHRFEALVRRGLHTKLARDERTAALSEALALWDTPLSGCFEDWALEEQSRLEARADEARQAQESLPPVSEPIPVAPAALVETTLPMRLSPFFGREAERTQVGALLQTARLLTLVGPGGVGKTSVALEVAREHAAAFGRVVFVSLAEIPIAALLLPTLRRALTDAPPADDPLAQVIAVLNDIPGKTLVLLDNLEHLLPVQSEDGEGEENEEKSRFSPARVVRELLESCPHLVIMATSRQPLGVESEQQYPLLTLAAATGAELFVNRARAARPDFTLHDGNKAEIEAICTLLDGLPLAIELAAAWVRVFSVSELRERLEKEALWLGGRRGDMNPRQKSLEATLRWSWQLLSLEQKRLLSALSVFRGGWIVEAAEAIGQGSRTLDVLFELVEKSLVVVEQGRSETRFRLLETIRQFAAERLEESGEQISVRLRHRTYFLVFVQRFEKELNSHKRATVLERIEREHDNCRVALAPPLDAASCTLAACLTSFWLVRGYFTEGREHLESALCWQGAQGPSLLRADLLFGKGYAERLQGSYRQAQPPLEEANRLYQSLGQPVKAAFTLQQLGILKHYCGDFPAARRYLEEGLALQRRAGTPAGIASLVNSLALILRDEGDFAPSRRYFEESWQVHLQEGDRYNAAIVQVNLGTVVLQQGDIEHAQHHFEQSLAILREFGSRRHIALLLSKLGNIALGKKQIAQGKDLTQESLRHLWELQDQHGMAGGFLLYGRLCQAEGNLPGAVLFWSVVFSLYKKSGKSLTLREEALWETELSCVREELGERAFNTAWQQGLQLPLEQVISLASTGAV